MAKIFNGPSPSNDGTFLTTLNEPKEKYPIPTAPERPEEFAPGLDAELQKMADAMREFTEKASKKAKTSSTKKK